MRFGGSEKVFPNFDPYGGLLFCDCAFGLRASPTFLEPPCIAGVQSRVGSSLGSSLHLWFSQLEGLSRAMIFLYGRVKALVWFWCINETLSANLVYQSDHKIGSTIPSGGAMVKIMMMVLPW